MRIAIDDAIRQLNMIKSSKDSDLDDAIDKALRGLRLKDDLSTYIQSRIDHGGYPLTASDDFIDGAKYAFSLVLDALDGFLLEPKGE